MFSLSPVLTPVGEVIFSPGQDLTPVEGVLVAAQPDWSAAPTRAGPIAPSSAATRGTAGEQLPGSGRKAEHRKGGTRETNSHNCQL